MTTAEKLFVQIFERKNWIIEQVKQQTDLYNHQLASKLLIDGIAPPSWLWNPNSDSQSSDPKELNKEELISELLLPHPRPTFPYSSGYCSLYNKPVVTCDSGDLSDGLFMGTHASKKYSDAGYGPKTVPRCRVNGTECSLNCVPEFNDRVTSPQDQAGGLFMETHASNKGIDEGNGPTSVPKCCDNATERALNCSPVVDLTATSPQAQRDVRVSNIYTVPDQSLARIQRSKSRQKALKLRNSATAASKRRLTNENSPGLSSSGITLSRIGSQTVDHANVLFELDKSSGILREAKEGNQSKENGTSSYFGRITRSRSSCKQHNGVNESLKVEKSVQTEKKDGGLLLKSSEDSQHPNHVNGLEAVNTFDVITGSCGVRDSTEKPGSLNEFPKLDASSYTGKASSGMCAQSMGKLMQQLDEANEFPEVVKSSSELIGRKTRSQTACSNEGVSKASSGMCAQPIGKLVQQLDDAKELSELVKSSSEFVGRKTRSQTACSNEGISQASSGMCAQSIGKLMQQLDDVNELEGVVKSSSEFIGRKTRSQTACSNEGISKPVNSSSIPRSTDTCSRSGVTKTSHVANLSNKFEGYALQDASDNKVILDCPCTHAVNQEGNNTTVVAIELVSDGPVEARPLCSGSNVHGVNLRVGSEGLVLRSPSESCMAVKPKQLDFYDVEEHNMESTFSPPSDNKRMGKSSDKICCTSSELAASLDKATPHSSNKDILAKQSSVVQVSPKEKVVWRRQNDSSVEKSVEDERKKFESNINPTMQNIEDNLEVILSIQNSTVLHGADIVLSDLHKSSDVGVHQIRCQSAKGYQSSLELQVEEGGLSYERRDRRETSLFRMNHNCLGPSLVSSMTKQVTAEPHDCLDKEVGMTDLTDTVLGGQSQDCVEDNNYLLPLENKFDCINTFDLVCTERLLRERNSDLGEAGLFYGSVGATHGEDGNLGLKPRDLQLANKSWLPEMRSSSAKVDSWPQFKRRKVEDHLTHSFSASPSFRVQKLHTTQGDPRSRCLKRVENNLDVVLQYQPLPLFHDGDVSPSNVSADVRIYQQMKCHSTNGIESPPRLQKEEAELGSEERNDGAEIPSTHKQEQTGPSLVSCLAKQAAGDSRGRSVEDVEIVDTTSNILDARYQHLLHLENKVNVVNADDLTGTETTLLERKSCIREDGLLSYNSIGSQHNNDLDLIGSEFEAFILDAQTENGRLDDAANGTFFGKLDLSCTTTERASIMEEICRSASVCTPFSHFSSKYNPHSTKDLYKSVPNGLLERMDLQNTLLNDEAVKQFRASYSGTDGNTAFTRVSYSDCRSYSAARFGWNSKNLYSSPVGKQWERISSGSGSSEKRLSFNPELTCFTIEEDPSIIEENEHADEVAHKIQEAGPTEPTEREPLSEITEACLHPSASVSVAEKFHDRSSLDSVSTEVSLAGTHNSAKQKPRNHYRNKKSTNEKQTLSMGTNGIKKVNKSLHNRFSKPKLSGKTSLKKGGQRFSEKVPKHNNIVSNITSFVPLVQQKQAAAVCTGKRDVKVRALEAAEAAKRLEEKRQNERMLKKEAMRLERARIEQENLRQRKLDKKKKEEEQKKKEADKAARKRLREEDEKKEKGRKRNRIEEARRQVKMQDEKVRAGEAEKEIQRGNKDQNVNSGKESDNRSGKSQQMKKESGVDKILEKPETELMTAGISTGDIREASDCYSDSDNRKVLGTLEKSAETGDLGTKKTQEKSYEISPYQCSDDEEEEEDDIQTKKFIPSWASKNCVALVLSSQMKIDPDVIFPRESFCSMDEVLLPRKLQGK